MLAGVTHAIHGSKRASLGERFMKFQLRTPRGERANAIQRAALMSIGREREVEERLQQKVAGYLKRRADVTRYAEKHIDQLNALVNMIAVIRAQVERDWKEQEIAYRPVPEMGTRLIKQLGKLGHALAFMYGDQEVGERAMKAVRRVAFDTAHGFHLDIIESMMQLGGIATKGDVCEAAGIPQMTLTRRFEDLSLLRVIERAGSTQPGQQGGRSSTMFRVTDEVAHLWVKSTGVPVPILEARAEESRRRVRVVRRHRR
jgi:hypothetical protein